VDVNQQLVADSRILRVVVFQQLVVDIATLLQQLQVTLVADIQMLLRVEMEQSQGVRVIVPSDVAVS
jgi:hypothetical protein